MRSLWRRGLKSWPCLVAGLAFVSSTGFATLSVEHASLPRSSDLIELAVLSSADQTVSVPAHLRATLAEIFVSIKSVGAVFWPLMTLLGLLLTLRLGAAIAGIGCDCGKLLIWATALMITLHQAPGVA
jgi:hypothetical protein